MNEHKYCNIIHLSEVISTNSYAKDLLQEEKPAEGTAIVTDYQTAGKGQDPNTWESEAGKNILMSMIFYPDFLDVARQFSISMAVALGIMDFLADLLPGKKLFVKWPNDIYVDKEKIGGILINNEIMGNSFEHVIAGIGININQNTFSKEIPNPVSLSSLTGKQYSLKDVTLRLCDCVMGRYEQLKEATFDHIRAEYHKNLLGMGAWREYSWQNEKITAKITGVNEFGKLCLETDGAMIECDLKEIVYLF